MSPPLGLKHVLKGAGFFALIGPLVGGLIIMSLISLRNGLGPISGAADIFSMALLLAIFSYVFGLLPALSTGLLACAALPYTRTLAAFLGVCVLASSAMAYLIAWMGLDRFSYSGAVLAAISAVPALITGSLWWALQHRNGKASDTPGRPT